MTRSRRVGYLMLVHPTFPAPTVTEFVAVARQKTLSYGASVGSTIHLAKRALQPARRREIAPGLLQGREQALNAVAGGEIQMLLSPPTAALPFVQSAGCAPRFHRLEALFQAARRAPRIGIRGSVPVDFTWNAWFAPARTPPAIVNRLHAAVREALKSPKVLDFLEAAAFVPVGSTPEEFREFVEAETKRYAQVVRGDQDFPGKNMPSELRLAARTGLTSADGRSGLGRPH